MSGGLIDRFVKDAAWLSNQDPDGVIYHAKLIKYSSVSSQNATKWLSNRGWRPIQKSSASKVTIEKWLPPHMIKKR